MPEPASMRPADIIAALPRYGDGPCLGRMRLGIARLAPHLPRGVSITGSNGKGSTAAMTAAILRGHGLKTGLFLSPHLIEPRERIQIDNTLIPEAALGRWLRQIDTTGRAAFEVWALIAAAWFSEQRAEVVVWEAGLGGRLDPTRVMPSAVTVLTQVALEHTAILGHSLAAITGEKAALRTPGTPLLAGPLPDAARAALPPDWQPGVDGPVTCALLGPHQRENARLALGAAKEVLGAGFDRALAHACLRSVRSPGRFQRVASSPDVYVDVAHDPSALLALADTVAEVLGARPLVVVVGVSADRPRDVMVPLAARLGVAVVATCAKQKGSPAHQIAAACPGPCHVAPKVSDALDLARDLAGTRGAAVLVCGGLFLAAEALQILGARSD